MKYNFSGFTEKANESLNQAINSAGQMGHTYVGSEHLLLAILSNKDEEVTLKLQEYNINYDVFKKEVLKVIGKGNISNNCKVTK